MFGSEQLNSCELESFLADYKVIVFMQVYAIISNTCVQIERGDTAKRVYKKSTVEFF